MKYFSMLIKPASSICNMRCEYCFYSDVSACRHIENYGVMKIDVMQALIDQTLGYFQEEVTITYAFQGGEPTCAGLDYFVNFIDYVNHHKKEYHHIQYALQTNGTLLTDEWIIFLKENNFLVGVSIDGFTANHDALRLDNKGEGTYQLIMSNIEKLRKVGVEFNILTVLTSQLSHKATELFNFYLDNQFDYIQLIPCLPAFENEEDLFALQPEEFYAFYDEFFQLWLEEYKKNHVMNVSYFDNLIPLFAGIPPQMCGFLGFCSMQFVVESDGSVYPCDFYVLDQYRIGNIKELTLGELAKARLTIEFINEPKKLTPLCQTCRYQKICGGQCKRMNVCYFNDSFCGLQAFMSKYEKILAQIASYIPR